MNLETDNDLLQKQEDEDLNILAFFADLIAEQDQDREPAKPTPIYTEEDENDLDGEDWEYIIHRTER